jgi:hypothetical protein
LPSRPLSQPKTSPVTNADPKSIGLRNHPRCAREKTAA